MTPNFTEFHAMLKVLDRLAFDGTNMFCVAPRQLGYGVYAYDFDAIMPMRVRFNQDGSVTEWADMGDDRDPGDHPSVTHSTIKQWLEKCIKEVTCEP